MQATAHLPHARTAALLGALGLASAMGIGRFAFTPMLPLMQHASGMPLQQGSWLASANYVGYLLGAVLCFAIDLRPGASARWGLVAVALSTLAMGLTESFAVWMLLRTIAGVASAFVLIGMASWALGVLAREKRAHWAGFIFCGVGLGIVLAGAVGLVAGASQWHPQSAWLLFGAMAAAIAVAAWRPLAHDASAPAVTVAVAGAAARFETRAWSLIVCYGVFGFGYIIPATFLPALGRQLFPDPLVFGWAWPAFGVAAAASVLIVAGAFKQVPPRRIVALGILLCAAGVLAPAVSPGLTTLLISALCVGGSFMAVTMAAFQEARLIAGVYAQRVIAAMTATFALGQLIGPLTVQSGSVETSLIVPSYAATAALLIAAIVLLRSPSRSAVPAPT